MSFINIRYQSNSFWSTVKLPAESTIALCLSESFTRCRRQYEVSRGRVLLVPRPPRRRRQLLAEASARSTAEADFAVAANSIELLQLLLSVVLVIWSWRSPMSRSCCLPALLATSATDCRTDSAVLFHSYQRVNLNGLHDAS